MAWVPAAIGGAASIVGDLFSQSGQSSANAANMAMQQQMEQWQKMMSDTAMQRRVTDLKAAGLNPLLAVGQGGASTPGISPVSIQNPAGAFSQLGGQVTSALQTATLASQVEAQKAQANKTDAEAQRTRAELPFSAETAQYSLENLKKQNDVLFWNANNLATDFNIKNDAQLPMLLKDKEFQQKLLDLKVDMARLDVTRAGLGMPRLENDATWQAAHPVLSGWLQSGAPDTAVNVASKAISSFNRLQFPTSGR